MKKIFALGLVLVLAVVGIIAAFSVTRVSTNPDQVALHYKAGPFSSTRFEDCVPQETREWHGPGDKHFYYPSAQIRYGFGAATASSGSAEAQPVVSLTQDNIEIITTGVITFKMDTDCEKIRKFHEEIGNRMGAYMDGTQNSAGWHDALAIYVRQPLQRAVNDASQKVNWRELYNDVEAKEAWEEEVKRNLPRYIQQTMGDSYFTDFAVTIQKPDLPDELKGALQATEVAREQNIAQEQRNNTVRTELETIEELVSVLGPEGYNTYQAIKDGRIPVYPIPQGSSVVVDPSLAPRNSNTVDAPAPAPAPEGQE